MKEREATQRSTQEFKDALKRSAVQSQREVIADNSRLRA